jgi:uncharacterized protein with NRDE domain
MCTIVVMQGVRRDLPVVLATNRDEFFARKSTGATLLQRHPNVVGGRDLEALGTWMGVSEHGLFVGVTNQRTFVPPNRALRSRGELVINALAAGSVEAASAYVKSVDPSHYNAFNLMFGDARGMFVAYGREQPTALNVEAVPEGIHVLPNDRLDSPDFFKVGRAQQLLAPLAQAPWEQLSQGLRALLSDHATAALDDIPEPPPGALFDRERIRQLSSLCVATPSYGTRSSTIVALTPGHVAHYLYADGPPDQSEFVDVRSLLYEVERT